MRPAKGDTRPHNLQHPWNMVANHPREAATSQVQQSCCDVLQTLSDYLAIEGDGENTNIDRDSARAQLDDALRQLRSERCQALADARAKCLVYPRLVASLNEDDPRLLRYARDLLLELADFLQEPSTISPEPEMDVHAMRMVGD